MLAIRPSNNHYQSNCRACIKSYNKSTVIRIVNGSRKLKIARTNNCSNGRQSETPCKRERSRRYCDETKTTSRQSSQDGCPSSDTVNINSEMSLRNNGQGSGTGRKRGHQHHPRNTGTRKRNEYNPDGAAIVINTLDSVIGNNDNNTVSCCVAVDTSNKDSIVNKVTLDVASDNKVTLINSFKQNEDSSALNNANNISVSNHDDTTKSETNSKKSNTYTTKSSKNALNAEQKQKKTRRSPNPQDISKQARPAAEGAACPEDADEEADELARLRCTSERTEVVAERENRRNKRRCADYPGLAFGRSIFSSDTMMKFAIIKNELHNIMNTQLKRAESEVAALNRRIQLLEEDLERSEERLATATGKLAEASQAADESERIRKALENRTNMEDDRVAILEAQLSQAKLIAEEADKKYEEVARKLVMMEQDLERAEERAEQGESKIVELEEELRVVGNNLKSLEVSEEKATHREEHFEGQVKVLDGHLKEAEARAEFAERSVQKLQKEVDRLEDDLLSEREKNKLLQDEMETTLHDIQNM